MFICLIIKKIVMIGSWWHNIKPRIVEQLNRNFEYWPWSVQPKQQNPFEFIPYKHFLWDTFYCSCSKHDHNKISKIYDLRFLRISENVA